MTNAIDFDKLKGPKIITCVNCEKNIGVITAKTERLTENRIGYFFCCDRCGYKYPFGAISEKGQKLLQKIKRKKKDMNKFPAIAKNINFALQQDLKAYQNEVEDSYDEEDVI